MVPIQVPQIVEVLDYHDFAELQDNYRKIVPGIKVKEIGHNPRTGYYVGIVYLRSLKEPKTAALYRAEKKHLQQIERDFDYNAASPLRLR